MTKDILIERAKELYSFKYDYSLIDKDFKTKEKLAIICPKHGVFYKTFDKHIGGKQGCPECSGRKRYDTESFIKKIKTLKHAENYDLSKINYINNKTHIIVTCLEHGDFKITPNHLLNGEGCPKCRYIKSADSKRRSIDKVINLAREIHGLKYNYSLITEYKNDRIKYPIICPEHGEFLQTFNNHIKGRQGCPKCGIIKYSHNRILSTKEFIDRSNEVHNFKYDYTKTNYVHGMQKVSIICPIHGIFEQRPSNHLFGQGCPKCFKEKSKVEKELFDFISLVLPNYSIIENDRDVLDGQEIDIFIPNLKVGFEMNGLLWHSEKYNDDKLYHINKTKKCLEKDIKLYHIFEDEWLNKKDICKSRIKHILNITSNNIFARKCIINKVNTKEQRIFFNNNHIQGYTPSKYAYGLYYNKELISLMAFGEIQNKGKYEILRFCTKINYNIPGGAERLLKKFIKEHNPKEIISYVDRRWSNGNLYEKIGFLKHNESNPNYYYVINKERKNRFNFKKSILVKKYNCPENMSEHEFCFSQKWYRIYDCGHLCYKWINNKIA